jgi:hypothetical protein
MITKTLELITLFLCLSLLSFAEDPPPDCSDPDLPPCDFVQVPLDDKLFLLVIGGVLYGVKTLRTNLKKERLKLADD